MTGKEFTVKCKDREGTERVFKFRTPTIDDMIDMQEHVVCKMSLDPKMGRDDFDKLPPRIGVALVREVWVRVAIEAGKEMARTLPRKQREQYTT